MKSIIIFVLVLINSSYEFEEETYKVEVLDLLNQHFENECKDQCFAMEHEIFLIQDLENHHKIIMASSIEPSCFSFGCAPKLSVFDYQLKNNTWQLTSSDIGFISHGHNGIGPKKTDVKIISDNAYAILTYDGFLHQGVKSGDVQVSVKVEGHFKPVFNEILNHRVDSSMNISLNYDNERDAYLDERFHGYTGNMEFSENNDSQFPNIVITRDGIHDDSLELLKLNRTDVFVFNGNEYQKQN